MNDSEEWRFQCETRHVIRLGDKAKVTDYIEKVKAKRGAAAADRLLQTSRDQYRLGNRAQQGEWK